MGTTGILLTDVECFLDEELLSERRSRLCLGPWCSSWTTLVGEASRTLITLVVRHLDNKRVLAMRIWFHPPDPRAQMNRLGSADTAIIVGSSIQDASSPHK